MRQSSLRALFTLALLVGCGDSQADQAHHEHGDDEDAQTKTDDGPDADDAADDDAGEAADASADRPHDAATRMDARVADSKDSGLRDASSAARDDRLQPFEVGRRWTYSLATLDGGGDATCQGSLESSITKTVMRDAAVGYEYLPTCFNGKVQMFLEGDDIWAYVGDSGRPTHYAASPVEAGVSWTSDVSTQYMWEAQDTIVVPAGSFDRCIRRTVVSAPGSYLLFCRGVGLVVGQNSVDNTRLELVSKNF